MGFIDDTQVATPALEIIWVTENTIEYKVTYDFSQWDENNINGTYIRVFIKDGYPMDEELFYDKNSRVSYSNTFNVYSAEVNSFSETITNLPRGYWIRLRAVIGRGTIENSQAGGATCYMHPGRFQMNAIAGEPISSVLNSTNIQKWARHLIAAYSWYTQTAFPDQKYQEFQKNITIPALTGKTISAKWFRNCLRALNTVRDPEYQFKEEEINSIVGLEESKTNGKTPTTITAELINKLSFSGIESATS